MNSHGGPFLKAGFWLVALTLAFLQAWEGRLTVAVDAISYSDLGDALLRGEWSTAINGYWSPLYPLLLGAAQGLLEPTSYWEFGVVNLVNWVTYAGALVSFDFLLRQVMLWHYAVCDRAERAPLPEWFWIVVGYSLFLWTSLSLIGLQASTPDLCVAAFLYLAAGLIVRSLLRKPRVADAALLGLVLGSGYLAKAVMFPMALVFLALSVLAWGGIRKALPYTLTAFALFAAVGGPWLVALSNDRGRWTFGDSGRIAYALSLDAGRAFRESGREISLGNFDPYPPSVVLASSRHVRTAPDVYEFGGEPGGTYPIWFDPSFWLQDLMPRFDLTTQLQLMLNNARTYWDIAFDSNGGFAAGALILLGFSLYGAPWRRSAAAMLVSWPLLLSGAAGLLIYSVGFAYPRYVAPFFTLIYLGLFASIQLPRTSDVARLARSVALTIVILTTLSMASLLVDGARSALTLLTADREPNFHAEVAQALQQMGLRPGDRVAGLRILTRPARTLLTHSKWARLARAQVVAEIVSDGQEPDADKADAVALVVRAGARVIVAEHTASWTTVVPWQPIGSTGFFAYFADHQ